LQKILLDSQKSKIHNYNELTVSGSSFPAVAALGPCIYAEVQFSIEFDLHNHGWSIIFAWIAAVCLAISFIFSFVLIFNGPEETHTKEIMRTDSTYPLA